MPDDSDFRISLQLLWGRRANGRARPAAGAERRADRRRRDRARGRRRARGGVDAPSRRAARRRRDVALSLHPGQVRAARPDARHHPRRGRRRAARRTTTGAPGSSGSRSAAARRIQRHPWMLQVVIGQRPPLGPNIIGDFDAYLQAVSGIGLTPPETIAVTELVGYYVQGATRADVEAAQTERESGVSDEQWWGERQEFWEEYFEPERFPAIFIAWEAGAYEAPLDSFEFGLQRILDGIEALLRAVDRVRAPERDPLAVAPHPELVQDVQRSRRSPARPARSPRAVPARRTRPTASARPPPWRSRAPTRRRRACSRARPRPPASGTARRPRSAPRWSARSRPRTSSRAGAGATP